MQRKTSAQTTRAVCARDALRWNVCSWQEEAARYLPSRSHRAQKAIGTSSGEITSPSELWIRSRCNGVLSSFILVSSILFFSFMSAFNPPQSPPAHHHHLPYKRSRGPTPTHPPPDVFHSADLELHAEQLIEVKLLILACQKLLKCMRRWHHQRAVKDVSPVKAQSFWRWYL